MVHCRHPTPDLSINTFHARYTAFFLRHINSPAPLTSTHSLTSSPLTASSHMSSILPIPQDLVALPLTLCYPVLIKLQATQGGIPLPMSLDEFKACAKLCGEIYDSARVLVQAGQHHSTQQDLGLAFIRPNRTMSLLLARNCHATMENLGPNSVGVNKHKTHKPTSAEKAELKAAQKTALAWFDQILTVTRAHAQAMGEAAIPIPASLLLMHQSTVVSEHLLLVHYTHGGIPLPCSEEDYTTCLVYTTCIIKLYPERRKEDKTKAKIEREAAEKFRSDLYQATSEYEALPHR